MATSNYSWNLPTVGGSEDTWGTSLNANWTDLDTLLGGVSQTEFAILNGATVTTAEINQLTTVTNGSARNWSIINMVTAAIRDSFNVASITDNGVGDFTISGNAGMASLDYSLVVQGSARISQAVILSSAPSYRAISENSTFSRTDATQMSSAVFGDLA